MDQLPLVRRRQTQRDLAADAQHLGHRQLALALQALVERLAFEELHGQEGHAAVLADLVDGDDVIVLDRCRRPRLAQEALPGRCAGGQRRQHRLERHQPRQLRVLGPEDDAHAARPQHLQHPVGPEPAQFVGRLGGARKA